MLTFQVIIYVCVFNEKLITTKVPMPAPTIDLPMSNISLFTAAARRTEPAKNTRLANNITKRRPIQGFNTPPIKENKAAKPTVIETKSS